MATTVTTWARGPLRLMPNPDMDTMAVDMDTTVDTVDTDTVDTTMVELLKIKSSGSSHSISFNLATTIVPSFFFERKIPSFFQCVPRPTTVTIILVSDLRVIYCNKEGIF